MNTHRELDQLPEKESETVEFKSSFNKEVIETIVAFSNTFDSFAVDTKLEDLDSNAIHHFYKKISESGRFHSSGSTKEDFIKLGLIYNDKLSRAAQLLFGMHHTGIHIGRFKTRERIIDDMMIRSPLMLAVEEVINFVKRNIRLGFEFIGELQRKEIWQFPMQAVRELVLNAIVHKDYANPTDVIIKIFDDSIEISNPGRLLFGLTMEDLQTNNYQAKHRNKLLTEAFYLTGDIEKYGTGYVRLREWLSEYPGMKYQLTDFTDFFRVEIIEQKKILVNDYTTEKTVEKNFKKKKKSVEKSVEKIMKYIKYNPKITQNELAHLSGLSRRGIEKNVKILKSKGIIERVGPDKGGYWKINEKVNF